MEMNEYLRIAIEFALPDNVFIMLHRLLLPQDSGSSTLLCLSAQYTPSTYSKRGRLLC